MKIEYVKSTTRVYIFLGVFLMLLGIVAFFLKTYWLQSYGQFFLGFCWLILGFYRKEKGYLFLEDNFLVKHDFPSWKVDLNEVLELRETENGYELKTVNKIYKIRIENIDNDSLLSLKSELRKLNIKDSSL